MLEILHVSDSHGFFFPLEKDNDLNQIIIHSGDLLPNKDWENVVRENEVKFQNEYVLDNIKKFKEWIGTRTFIHCMGNHDFIDPCYILQQYGINAHSITNRRYSYQGIRIYGFPWIPYMNGRWNAECTIPEMARQIKILKKELELGIDILVCHCPPYGILDADFVIRDSHKKLEASQYANHIGNTLLTNLLNEMVGNIDKINWPKYLLCGHCHEHHGWEYEFDMIISNAATIVNDFWYEF